MLLPGFLQSISGMSARMVSMALPSRRLNSARSSAICCNTGGRSQVSWESLSGPAETERITIRGAAPEEAVDDQPSVKAPFGSLGDECELWSTEPWMGAAASGVEKEKHCTESIAASSSASNHNRRVVSILLAIQLPPWSATDSICPFVSFAVPLRPEIRSDVIPRAVGSLD
jgi:hypothetical protein